MMLPMNRFEHYFFFTFSAILLLFLNLKLEYDKDVSTTIYHAYAFVASCFAIVGAIIADSWLGMCRSIVLVSVVFAAGAFIISVGVIDDLYLPLK